MKNREVWESYDHYTGEITKHARYLGFMGIAICWFFRSPSLSFPSAILGALIGLVFFFLLDLAQYYVAALRLKLWMEKEEEKRKQENSSIEGDYWPPKSLDHPVFVLFHCKLVALLIGFACIGFELVSRM